MILDGSSKNQEIFSLRNWPVQKLNFGAEIIHLTLGAFVKGPGMDKSLSLTINSTMRSRLVKCTYSGAQLPGFESWLHH